MHCQVVLIRIAFDENHHTQIHFSKVVLL